MNARQKRGSAWLMIINEQDELLLLKRSSKANNPGLWNLPGGGIDKGETADVSVIREAREEAGLKVGAVRHICSLPLANGKMNHFYLAKWKNTLTKVKINNESSEFAWVKIPRAKTLALHAPTALLLRHLEKGWLMTASLVANDYTIEATPERLGLARLYCIQQQGQTIGSAQVMLPTGTLYNFGVQREYRNTGVGQHLLQFILATGDVQRLVAKATDPSQQARLVKFYQRNGFVAGSPTGDGGLAMTYVKG